MKPLYPAPCSTRIVFGVEGQVDLLPNSAVSPLHDCESGPLSARCHPLVRAPSGGLGVGLVIARSYVRFPASVGLWRCKHRRGPPGWTRVVWGRALRKPRSPQGAPAPEGRPLGVSNGSAKSLRRGVAGLRGPTGHVCATPPRRGLCPVQHASEKVRALGATIAPPPPPTPPRFTASQTHAVHKESVMPHLFCPSRLFLPNPFDPYWSVVGLTVFQ